MVYYRLDSFNFDIERYIVKSINLFPVRTFEFTGDELQIFVKSNKMYGCSTGINTISMEEIVELECAKTHLVRKEKLNLRLYKENGESYIVYQPLARKTYDNDEHIETIVFEDNEDKHYLSSVILLESSCINYRGNVVFNFADKGLTTIRFGNIFQEINIIEKGSKCNFDNIEDLSGLFKDIKVCEIYLGDLNLPNIKNMSNMFNGCTNSVGSWFGEFLSKAPEHKVDTSYMFTGCDIDILHNLKTDIKGIYKSNSINHMFNNSDVFVEDVCRLLMENNCNPYSGIRDKLFSSCKGNTNRPKRFAVPIKNVESNSSFVDMFSKSNVFEFSFEDKSFLINKLLEYMRTSTSTTIQGFLTVLDKSELTDIGDLLLEVNRNSKLRNLLDLKIDTFYKQNSMNVMNMFSYTPNTVSGWEDNRELELPKVFITNECDKITKIFTILLVHLNILKKFYIIDRPFTMLADTEINGVQGQEVAVSIRV